MTYTCSMTNGSSTTVPVSSTVRRRVWPMRLWLGVPDWAFCTAGALFFFGYVLIQAQKYWQAGFWELGPYYIYADGRSIHMPWVPVLVDLTFVLIVLSFLVRVAPRQRVQNGWVVVFTLFTGFGPLLPIWLSPVLGIINPAWHVAYENFLWRSPISATEIVVGGVLVTVGNLLDVSGYMVLLRSFSIVPEARKLITSGPYRFVRHPVYLGQFLAQAGVWLFFAQLHVIWITFYFVFVAMQLYRSKLEDLVLAEAFGDECRQWQRRTFWFGRL